MDEDSTIKKVIKIFGISLLILSPFILFLLTLLIPVSKVNGLANKLGVNNIVGKYYTSNFYATAFKFVNKDRLSCTKDGKSYFLGEYYFSENNCFLCLCVSKDKFNCVSNSSNSNPYCLSLPNFIPVASNQKSADTNPELVLPSPSASPNGDTEPQILQNADIPQIQDASYQSIPLNK